VRQGIVEQIIPHFLRADPVVDQLQKQVKTRCDRHHLFQRPCRIDAVEQGQGQLRILPCICGDALFAHPPGLFALDRGGHKPVGNDPPRDD
jgi:hypothetical protein